MLSLLEIQSRYQFQSRQLCPIVEKLKLCASAQSWILLPLSEWGGGNAGAFTWEVKNYLLGNRGNRSSLSTAELLRENSFCAGLALFIHSLKGQDLPFPSGNHSAKGFSYYMIVSFCCQTTAKAHISVQFMNSAVTINLLKVNKFGESSLVSHPFSSLQGHETSVCWAHTW